MSKRDRVVSAICGIALLGVAIPTLAAPFDGTYTGKRVLTKGDNPTCPTEDPVSVTINDNVLTFTNSALKNYAIGFDPQPDGSFDEIHTEMDGNLVDIRGRIVGNTLDADVTNAPCEYHWHAEKKP